METSQNPFTSDGYVHHTDTADSSSQATSGAHPLCQLSDLSLAQQFLRLVIRMLIRLFYRVSSRGWENLPANGGAIVIANHVSYIDALILAAQSPRPMRFLSHERFQPMPIIGSLLRLAGVIPVSAEHPRDAIRRAVACAKQGEIVALFPEGKLSRNGRIDKFQRGFSCIADLAKVPVIPVFLDGLWGSLFSFAEGRFFWKRPRQLPRRVAVTVGPALSHQQMNPDNARQTILDMGTDSYARRPELQGHLATRTIESLCHQASREVVVDYSAGRRSLDGSKLVALATALGSQFRRDIPEQRVGIVLPPSLGGAIANLAVSFAEKTPVNLNFTLGKKALESCLRRAGIKTIITAAPVREKIDQKFSDFPWPENIIDIKDNIDSLPKAGLLARILGAKFLPTPIFLRLIKAPRGGGDQEAALLFTSGSDGEPKGVVLTHRNIIGNSYQVMDCGIFPDNESILANLPIFHSFGFTVTLWAALLARMKVVFTPSPLDFKLAAKAIQTEKCSILLGTPTFLRPYLTRVEPEQMTSVKMVVAGAEKTPAGFRETWEKRFPGSYYLEGYGLTETTPVTAVNVPDEYMPKSQEGTSRTGTRAGSVGRLFHGMAAEVIDPDTGAPLPLGQTGILKLKGVNIFAGYLNEPEKTASVLKDGWLTTGDLARIDEDGFLFIEGRLSRFSKIGGEMVPHGTVETCIAQTLGVDTSEQPQIAVTARIDESKGEALVLVTAIDIDADELRRKLADQGLPNLWIPREIRRVDTIPTLASGKLELSALKKIATEREGTATVS